MGRLLALLAVAAALNSFVVVWAAPGVSVNLGVIKFGGEKTFDKITENVQSKIYNIISTSSTTKGKCTKRVTVTGNGIGDVFNLPCSENGVISTTTDKILIYGNPKVDSFFMFSDEPSHLTVFKDNKCTKRTYTTMKKKTSSMITELKEEDCQKIASKIIDMEEQQTRFLEAMDNHVNGKDDDKGTSSQASSGANSQFKSTSTGKGADSQIPSEDSENNDQAEDQAAPAAAAPATEVSSDTAMPVYHYSSGPLRWNYQSQSQSQW